MLNDVHPPPLEPEFDPAGKRVRSPVHRSITAQSPPARNGAGPHLSDRHDRVHDLDRSTHGEGHNLVYDEPEDRGDSFNTTLSTIVVLIVLAVVAAVAISVWWH